MHHFTLDGRGGHRSRYDDIALIFELLDEAPAVLGLEPAMPPMILPYYNGVTPDDSGISAFVFVAGGHVTLHTFSFRECFFADVIAPQPIDCEAIEQMFRSNFATSKVDTQVDGQVVPRSEESYPSQIETEADFGPHLHLSIDGYDGPTSMDDLFALFDHLPEQIEMTPIMRPYVLRSQLGPRRGVTSAITMLAESHIALHIFEDTKRAFLDIFSCSFFDVDSMVARLKEHFSGKNHIVQLTVRGRGFRECWTGREQAHAHSRRWLDSRPPRR